MNKIYFCKCSQNLVLSGARKGVRIIEMYLSTDCMTETASFLIMINLILYYKSASFPIPSHQLWVCNIFCAMLVIISETLSCPVWPVTSLGPFSPSLGPMPFLTSGHFRVSSSWASFLGRKVTQGYHVCKQLLHHAHWGLCNESVTYHALDRRSSLGWCILDSNLVAPLSIRPFIRDCKYNIENTCPRGRWYWFRILRTMIERFYL